MSIILLFLRSDFLPSDRNLFPSPPPRSLSRSPEDTAVLKELNAVRNTIKKERRAEASLFKGLLPAASPAAAAAAATSAPIAAALGAAARDGRAASAGTHQPTQGTSQGRVKEKTWSWFGVPFAALGGLVASLVLVLGLVLGGTGGSLWRRST